MITLDRLRYFVVAAQCEHVGAAAKTLRISPSVVSSAIKELEDDIGSTLFSRIGNRIQLNQAGRIALDSALRILSEVDIFKQQAKLQVNEIKGHYRLGASHLLMTKFLIPACLQLQKKHRELTFDFATTDTSQCIAQIKSSQLDSALVFRSSYSEKIGEKILFSDQFKIYVRKNHEILSKKDPIKILNELPAITFKAQFGGNFWHSHPAFVDIGITPKHSYYYNDTDTAVGLLRKTDGWAFMPSLVGSQYPELSELKVSQKYSSPVNVSFVFSESARIRDFIDKLSMPFNKHSYEQTRGQPSKE